MSSPLITAVPDEIEVPVGVFSMSLPRPNPTKNLVGHIWNSQVSGQGSTSCVITNYGPIEDETPPPFSEPVALIASDIIQQSQHKEEPVVPKVDTALQPPQHQEEKVEGLCCCLS